MKSNFIIFVIISAFFVSCNLAHAKDEIKTDFNQKIIESLPEDSSRPSDETIKSIDFDKMIREAQEYSKKAKQWKKLKCTPKTGFICAKWTCKEKTTNTYLILDKKNSEITRCDGEYCETIPSEFMQNGVYVNIQTKGPLAILIKVLGNSRYKEITTIGLDAYIGNGNCEI
jgi:hypothetical protein